MEKKKRKLIRKLEKEGVTWWAPNNRKWLAGLLENKRAMTPLFKYLEATKLGARKREREKEQK